MRLRPIRIMIPFLILVLGGCDLANLPDGLVNPSNTPSQNSPNSTVVSSVVYSQDIQPYTGAASCKACHQGGSAPQLGLGTFAVDSQVNASKLRSMLNQYGNLPSGQLAKIDAWITAGRPEAQTPVSSTSSGTTNGTPQTSPHASGWRSQHGNVVQSAGGVHYAKISNGMSCASCHTVAPAANGSIPKSPAANYTCYSCHNGPSGGEGDGEGDD